MPLLQHTYRKQKYPVVAKLSFSTKLLTGHSPESNSLVFPAHKFGSFPFSEIEVLLTYLHIVDPDDIF